MYDVVVIGGGVIGGMVLRELTKYSIDACLLEKESDVAMGSSKANSGIVHAGFDAKVGSLKAKFNVLGNLMMESVTSELNVKYKNNGSLVVAFSDDDVKMLEELKLRGEQNGVTGLEIISKEELKKLEPNVSDNAICALFAKTGGIVCPYELTIASIGNAMDNGADLKVSFDVSKIDKEGDVFVITSKKGETVKAKIVINCAGFGSQKIANLIGDESFNIGARKGEYILLDREAGDFVSHTLFFTPTAKGKGILCSNTVDGNILLGPTADEQYDEDTTTSNPGLSFVQQKAKEMCNGVPFDKTITSFAGVRAYCDRHDFVIEKSLKDDNFINCAGIESPGLTSAPAIAKYVVEELVSTLLPLKKNENFNGYRKADCFFKEMSLEEKNELIKKDPSFGKIVCRCEQVTEGEILHAIRTNPKANDIDGVKRRTRSGMGRCQGGFCQPYVLELIAKEKGIDVTEVTKKGDGSYLLTGVTK